MGTSSFHTLMGLSVGEGGSEALTLLRLGSRTITEISTGSQLLGPQGSIDVLAVHRPGNPSEDKENLSLGQGAKFTSTQIWGWSITSISEDSFCLVHQGITLVYGSKCIQISGI